MDALMFRWRWFRGYTVPKYRERAEMRFAWALPRRLAYWAAIRVIANATTGQYGSTVVPELTAMDALKRWEAQA
jgi:hypothetical protein